MGPDHQGGGDRAAGVTRRRLGLRCPCLRRDELRAAQPDVQIFVYDADHGFNCDERGSYDETSASLALDRTLNFFGKHMSYDPDSTVVMPPR